MGLLLRYGRIGVIVASTVWIGLAIGHEGFSRYGGASIALIALVAQLAFVWTYRLNTFLNEPFYRIHTIACSFHLISSCGIGWATAANDSSWKSVITRERSFWVPLNETLASDCSKGCFVERSNVVVTQNFPLIDVAIIFASISAFFHFVTAENRNTPVVGKSRSEPTALEIAALAERINGVRWLDYSCSASIMLVCISSLCGVTSVFTLLGQLLLQFILLDYAGAVEVELSRNPPTFTNSFGLQELVTVLYSLYYIPLLAAFIANSADENSQAGPIITVVVTSLHYCVGIFIALYSGVIETVKARIGDPVAVTADIFIVVGLSTGAAALQYGPDHEDYAALVVTSIFFAAFGNTFCLYTNLGEKKSSVSPSSPFLAGRPEYAFTVLCIVYGLMWAPTISVFASSFEKDGEKPPDAIYTILVVLILLYTAFAVWYALTSIFQLGSPASCEVGYIALSFVTKTILHWLLYNGITGRDGSIFVEVDLENQTDVLTGAEMADDPASLVMSTVIPLIIGIALAVYGRRILLSNESGDLVKPLSANFY